MLFPQCVYRSECGEGGWGSPQIPESFQAEVTSFAGLQGKSINQKWEGPGEWEYFVFAALGFVRLVCL